MTVRRAAIGVAFLGLAVLVAGLGFVLTSGPGARHVGAAVPTVTAGTLPAAAPTSRPAGTTPAPPPAADARLTLPRLDLDARVVRVRLHGSTMQVPRNPDLVGWWSQGVAPGAAHGSAVLVGHVNYAGQAGAFALLPKMRPGDVLRLTDPGRRFRVAAVRSYPKSTGLPQRIFAADGPPQLVLITCGGSFDAGTGNYVDNIVVYAEPL